MVYMYFTISHAVMDCGEPDPPTNGFLEDNSGSEIFYQCNEGFLPTGRMMAVCTEEGWSPDPANLSCTEGMWLHG